METAVERRLEYHQSCDSIEIAGRDAQTLREQSPPPLRRPELPIATSGLKGGAAFVDNGEWQVCWQLVTPVGTGCAVADHHASKRFLRAPLPQSLQDGACLDDLALKDDSQIRVNEHEPALASAWIQSGDAGHGESFAGVGLKLR